MRYCIDYKRNFKYLSKIDEITINFRRQDTSLFAFLSKYKNKVINIFVEDEKDFIENDCVKFFDAIKKENPDINFYFKLNPYYKSKELYIILKSHSHKYFFNEYVHDWDVLYGYINLEPSSIYITEDLGFEIKTIAEILHSKNIQIRCFPNVAQSRWKQTPALKKFFIRPDDIEIYEKYIDICEFFGKENSLATYYEIYSKDKKWSGKLNEVILDFNSEIDNRFLIPSFAGRRINCGKRCLKGHPCRICEATEQLSATLEEKKIILKEIKE